MLAVPYGSVYVMEGCKGVWETNSEERLVVSESADVRVYRAPDVGADNTVEEGSHALPYAGLALVGGWRRGRHC